MSYQPPRLRDRILIWLWPDLEYKLTITFTEDEAEAVDYLTSSLPLGRLHNLMCMVRMKVNPLREKFYTAEAVKKEWGL